MEPTVITFSSFSKAENKDIPSVVIIVTENGVAASGDPSKMASMVADEINTSFRGLTGKDLEKAVAEMMESYEAKASTGYGKSVVIAPYVGSAKTAADKIVADWLKARTDKATGTQS